MLETDARDRVIVALDCDRERALELAHELSGHAAWLKVGMTLYYAEGPEIVKTFKDLGFKVFLDLKFHDIPHQVRGAARSASLAGADLLSVHGLGSGAMLAACREGAEEAREDRAKLVAITVLTSMNQDALSEIGVESPVAEEAALTAEVLGNQVTRLYDVGVAGLHRTLSHLEDIMSARVIIAIAGMEGALASVIGGLSDCPVIAVPTSVGYGASFGGVAALLAMLNSCASGVSVVNIDNGFGAAYQASLINHLNAGTPCAR